MNEPQTEKYFVEKVAEDSFRSPSIYDLKLVIFCSLKHSITDSHLLTDYILHSQSFEISIFHCSEAESVHIIRDHFCDTSGTHECLFKRQGLKTVENPMKYAVYHEVLLTISVWSKFAVLCKMGFLHV